VKHFGFRYSGSEGTFFRVFEFACISLRPSHLMYICSALHKYYYIDV
jgi:hypothetical protein